MAGTRPVSHYICRHDLLEYQVDPDSLPQAAAISETTLSLPLSAKLTDEDRNDVVEALHEALS